MAKNRETTHVQNPALLAVGQRPDVLVWRQQSGLFYTRDGTPVRVGVPGLADSGMIVAVTITKEMVGKTIGVAVQPEFKVRDGQQSEAQRNWQAAVEARGGVYRLVRSAEDMTRLVADVQNGTAWS
ncbi:MAG TPA: hypothetical protein VFM10_12860 [Terriglobales bacterium]|nr:hypothetical protein [Terriglobales bacterium]